MMENVGLQIKKKLISGMLNYKTKEFLEDIGKEKKN